MNYFDVPYPRIPPSIVNVGKKALIGIDDTEVTPEISAKMVSEAPSKKPASPPYAVGAIFDSNSAIVFHPPVKLVVGSSH